MYTYTHQLTPKFHHLTAGQINWAVMECNGETAILVWLRLYEDGFKISYFTLKMSCIMVLEKNAWLNVVQYPVSCNLTFYAITQIESPAHILSYKKLDMVESISIGSQFSNASLATKHQTVFFSHLSIGQEMNHISCNWAASLETMLASSEYIERSQTDVCFHHFLVFIILLNACITNLQDNSFRV